MHKMKGGYGKGKAGFGNQTGYSQSDGFSKATRSPQIDRPTPTSSSSVGKGMKKGDSGRMKY